MITTSDNATTARSDSLTGRGFTGHEHFTEVGLIHMNGRMYDAQQGRFLSPDNHIQDPFNTQNFNRFGYVLNNPLSLTDPSGELIGFVIAVAKFVTGFLAYVNVVESVVYGAPIGNILLNIGLAVIGTRITKGLEGLFSAAGSPLGAFVRDAVSTFGGRFISGTLGSVASGKNLKHALRANFAPAGISAAMAGIVGASEFKANQKALSVAKAKRMVAEELDAMAAEKYAVVNDNSGVTDGQNTSAFAEGTMTEWMEAGRAEEFGEWLAANPPTLATPKYPSGYAKPMGFDSPFFGFGGVAKLTASSGFKLSGNTLKLSDYIRFGNTHIPPGVSGQAKSVFTFAVKGGGKNMSFHYHIHKYNWYKPQTWFKYTPTPKK